MSRHDQHEGDPWGYSWSYGSMDDQEILGEGESGEDSGGEGSGDGCEGGPGFGPAASSGCLVTLGWTGLVAGIVAATAGRFTG